MDRANTTANELHVENMYRIVDGEQSMRMATRIESIIVGDGCIDDGHLLRVQPREAEL